MARYNPREVNMNKENAIIKLNGADFGPAIATLSKSGLIMWFYFMTLQPGEKITIHQPTLAKQGITANMIQRGCEDLEKHRFLIDGIFYAAPLPEPDKPDTTVTRSWKDIF